MQKTTWTLGTFCKNPPMDLRYVRMLLPELMRFLSHSDKQIKTNAGYAIFWGSENFLVKKFVRKNLFEKNYFPTPSHFLPNQRHQGPHRHRPRIRCPPTPHAPPNPLHRPLRPYPSPPNHRQYRHRRCKQENTQLRLYHKYQKN